MQFISHVRTHNNACFQINGSSQVNRSVFPSQESKTKICKYPKLANLKWAFLIQRKRENGLQSNNDAIRRYTFESNKLTRR